MSWIDVKNKARVETGTALPSHRSRIHIMLFGFLTLTQLGRLSSTVAMAS